MKKRIIRKIGNYAARWKRSYINRGLDHPRTVRLERTIINLAKIYGEAPRR